MAIVAIIGLSSCAGFTTNAGAGKPQTSSAGILSPSSTSLAFASVSVGSTSAQSLSVTNTGTAAVNISQAVIAGTGFTVVGGDPSSSLPVGQSSTIQVQFAPQSPGAVSGTLTVMSDASNSPLTIPLSGTGMQAGLAMSPASLNFGTVTMGQSSTQSVKLTNSGNANLNLTATLPGNNFTDNLVTPMTINAGASATFNVQFTPTSSGGVNGSIVFTDNASGSPQTLILSGSGQATNSTLTPNPGNVPFANVIVGSNSTQPITLTNSGTASVSITQINITTGAGFSQNGLSVGQTIAAGATASFTAEFAPTAIGLSSGNITLTSTASNPTVTIALSGTGTQGQLSVNPSSVNFGSLPVNSSATVPVTLSNTGTAPVGITAAGLTGSSFFTSTLASQTINPGQTASFNVKFAPTSTGSASGNISITNNAPGSPLVIPLSGTGTQSLPQLTISPASVNFNTVNVGSNATQTITLNNTGNAALNITADNLTGPGFTMTLTPQTINAGASATFSVQFAPTTEGAGSGSISITSNAPGSPATIPLSGTGLQALGAANPTSVAFGSVVTGTSNSQPIILTNNGNAVLTFSQVNVSTGFSITGLTTSTTIAAGASQSFNIHFAPTTSGPVSGAVTLFTNGSPAQLAINLTGTGVTATFLMGANPTSLSFGAVNVGGSSSQNVTLTNNGNSNVTISTVTFSGAGISTSGVSNGTILAPLQTATLTVTYAPTVAGTLTGADVSAPSTATNSPTTITVSGSAVQAVSHSAALSWTASTTTTVRELQHLPCEYVGRVRLDAVRFNCGIRDHVHGYDSPGGSDLLLRCYGG